MKVGRSVCPWLASMENCQNVERTLMGFGHIMAGRHIGLNHGLEIRRCQSPGSAAKGGDL